MDEREDLPSIHERVAATLVELGFSNSLCHRTGVLIQNGYCKGRQFFYDGVRVIWRIEDASLEFYAEQGQLLRRVALSDPPVPQRCAA